MNTNYKYVSPSTKLLLANGTEKFASELKIGDTLLGSIPTEERIIVDISEHDASNYLVIPRYCNSPFIISELHFLPVIVENRVALVNINDFRRTELKNQISLIHEAIELQQIQVTLEPYMLGLWLSNCDTITPTTIRFPKKNMTVVMFIVNFIVKFNLEHIDSDDYIDITDKRLVRQFHNYDLFNTPTIPNPYKYNKSSIRSRLLAGFMDNNEPEIEIRTKRLKDDFCFLVHSMGMLTLTRRKDDKWFVTVFFNSFVINDFKVAKLEGKTKSLCLQITGMAPGILLPDFTMI